MNQELMAGTQTQGWNKKTRVIENELVVLKKEEEEKNENATRSESS